METDGPDGYPRVDILEILSIYYGSLVAIFKLHRIQPTQQLI